MISIIAIIVLGLAETVRMETCASIKQLPVIDLETKVPVDIQKDCGPGAKPCVIKCCPKDEVLYKIPYKQFRFTCRNLKELSKEYSSTAVQELSSYSTMDIRSVSGSDKQLSFFEDFRLLYSDRFVNKACNRFQYYAVIYENGTASWNPAKNMWTDAVAPDFCMDKLLGARASGGLTYAYVYYFRFDDLSPIVHKTMFFSYGGLVSAFFMVLVLVVHCLLKVLHGNPKGKLFIGFLINMMLYFVYNSWYSFSYLANYENSSTNGGPLPACKWVSPIGYYLFVAAFFWLNAMCYDIWRKFRSSKLKSFDDKKKMRQYSAYAIGMPLLCTVVCLLCDQYGSEHVRPRFDFCMQDEVNNLWKRLYLRLPTGLVVLSNVVMLVLTIINVRRVREEFRRSARHDSTRTRKGEILSNVFRKLSILMGVNWLIEIILTPIVIFEEWVYYLVFLPNTLLGVWIFLATVCSKDIFIQLCRRFRIVNKWTQDHPAPNTTTQVTQNISTSRATTSKSKNDNTDMA